jgi:hypothetical protein
MPTNREWRQKLGKPSKETPNNDPRSLLAKTIGYLEHNQPRMNYPAYRKQGLPMTTAWMESAVKEVNYRTKGTEMLWDEPLGVRGNPTGARRRVVRRQPARQTHGGDPPRNSVHTRPKKAQITA